MLTNSVVRSRLFANVAVRSRSLKRPLSSNTPVTSIPGNLHLADAAAILSEGASTSTSKSKLLAQVKPSEFYFPPLDVPRSIAVAVFAHPGQYSEKEAALERTVFGVALRKDIVHEVIRYQRHKARQPKKTKTISEIRGSNKKPRPQKGQGFAQVGNRRNSVWRGGMKAHGPVIRDYSISLNRKMRAMGMMIALTAKFREGNLLVVEDFSLAASGEGAGVVKTKDVSALLSQHGVGNTTALLVDSEVMESFELACRNMALATLVPQTKANVLDIVKREKLVLTRAALEALQARLLEQFNYKGKRKFEEIQARILEEAVAQKERSV